MATNSEVATTSEIGDATVRRYDKIVLKQDTPPPCFDGLGNLLITENSVRKGQCYVSVMYGSLADSQKSIFVRMISPSGSSPAG